jgi:hypothetical protein
MDVSTQVLVLFLLIVIGWIARKAGVLDDTAISRFSAFVLNVTLPGLILTALQRPYSPELLRQSMVVLALSLSIYGASFLLAFLYPRLIGASRFERGVHSYAIIFSNVGYMGYPVVEAILGPESLFFLAIYNISFNLFAFGFGAWFISRDGNRKLKLSWKMLVNPCVISTIIGFILFLASVQYPAALGRALKMTGDITSPLSMIIVGAILGRMDPRVVFGRWRTYVTSLVRLILWPGAIAAVLYAAGLRGLLFALPVLVLALPVAASTPIVANVYEGDVDSGSSLVFISTLACVATIPVVAALVAGL